MGLECANRVINCSTLGIRVFTHRNIVGMVIVMHVGDREAKTVFGLAQANPVGLPWHVFADQPHAGEVGVLIHHAGKVASPGPGFEKAAMNEGPREIVSIS